MRVHNPLDKVLNNEVKIKILRFLCKTDAQWTGRQIAYEINVSPAATHKALRELNNEKVLLLRSVGRSYLYQLNRKNFIISELLKPLYEKENKIPNEVYKEILRGISSRVIRSIVSIAVFGSIKKQKERPTSDIDLLVLLKNFKDKERIEEDFGKVNEKVMDKFGNTVSTYIQTIPEFRLKYKKDSALIKNILKYHNLLFGKPLERLI